MKGVISTLVVAISAACQSFAEKPNVVLIMADDLGPGDVSHYVRTQMDKEPLVETPVMDALIQRGLYFTDGHSATALCSPTRYCVMSGNNNFRSYAPWGVWGTFRKSAFQERDILLGSLMAEAGYATGFVGKWHLGGDFRVAGGEKIYRGEDRAQLPMGKVDLTKMVGGGPKQAGFAYDFTLPCGIQGPIYTAYENGKWHPLGEDSEIVFLNKDNARNPHDVSDKGPGMGDSAWEAREMGKLLSQKAADFIATSAAQDDPFFLYYCSPMVHIPHVPPAEFDGKPVANTTVSRHLDMVIDLDQQVGRLVKALEATGELDNTLIIFTSDNGGLVVDPDTRKSGHKSAGPWRGSKNHPHEGGHRVPTFVVWPGVVKPGVTDEFITNTDMVATFAALVGRELAEDQAMDSHNLLPLLRGDGTYRSREVMVHNAGAQKQMIYRKGQWKLIVQCDAKLTEIQPIELYDLASDPFEKGNQLKKEPARVEAMLDDFKGYVIDGKRTVE